MSQPTKGRRRSKTVVSNKRKRTKSLSTGHQMKALNRNKLKPCGLFKKPLEQQKSQTEEKLKTQSPHIMRNQRKEN